MKTYHFKGSPKKLFLKLVGGGGVATLYFIIYKLFYIYINQKPLIHRVHRFNYFSAKLMNFKGVALEVSQGIGCPLWILCYPFSKPTNYWYLHLQPIKNAAVRSKESSNWSSHLKKIIIKNIIAYYLKSNLFILLYVMM